MQKPYRGISLVGHAGKILPKILARHLNEQCGRVGILPEDQSDFRPKRSTTDMLFVILNKAYDSVDRTLLWTVLARVGVLQNVILAFRQFHDDMRACVRLDERVCSRWFTVEQGLHEGCVPTPLLFNISFAAAINVAYKRFKADRDIMNALVHLGKIIRVIVVVCAGFGLTVSETRIAGAHEEVAGAHGHIQRRGRGPGIQPNERVRIPGGERQPFV